jgi:hypothetical protein
VDVIGEGDCLQRLSLQHADIVRLGRRAETIMPKYRNSAIRLYGVAPEGCIDT